MKKIFIYPVLLFSLSVLTACSSSSENKEATNLLSENTVINSENETETKKIAIDQDNTQLTIDITQWKEEKSLPGISFSYPSEFTFETDGLGGGGRSILEGADGHPYLTIIQSNLQKCKSDDCDVSTLIDASPEEVYNEILKGVLNSEDTKVGDIEAKKYIDPEASSTNILFKSKEGVFILQTGDNADLKILEKILKTFKVK